MQTPLRFLALVGVGIGLTLLGVSVIGWLAAVAWDRETYLQISRNALLSFAVLTLGMAAIPVALLGLVTGALASPRLQLPSTVQLLLVSLPWVATLALPPSGITDTTAWLSQLLTNSHTLAVLAALPTGYLLGAYFFGTRARGSAA